MGHYVCLLSPHTYCDVHCTALISQPLSSALCSVHHNFLDSVALARGLLLGSGSTRHISSLTQHDLVGHNESEEGDEDMG